MEKDSENSMGNSNLILKEVSKEIYTYVILKKQMKDFGSQVIINEFGKVIGNIKFNIFNLNIRLELPEILGNNIIRIEGKKSRYSKKRLIKDKSHNIMGEIKKKIFHPSASKIFLKDKNGNKQYICVGDFNKWNYRIYNVSDNKVVAIIKEFNEKDSLAQNLHINLENHFYMEFIKSNIEKSIIISLVITISNTLCKFHKLSDVTGFARRVATLRPFGPGNSYN